MLDLGVNFPPVYNFPIGFWNCSDIVEFLIFHFISQLIQNIGKGVYFLWRRDISVLYFYCDNLSRVSLIVSILSTSCFHWSGVSRTPRLDSENVFSSENSRMSITASSPEANTPIRRFHDNENRIQSANRKSTGLYNNICFFSRYIFHDIYYLGWKSVICTFFYSHATYFL